MTDLSQPEGAASVSKEQAMEAAEQIAQLAEYAPDSHLATSALATLRQFIEQSTSPSSEKPALQVGAQDNCPDCGHSWEAHDFGVPKPSCPVSPASTEGALQGSGHAPAGVKEAPDAQP